MQERKVCVVSGSSSGIGAATVRRYAREGWDVVINYSRNSELAEAVALECRTLGAHGGNHAGGHAGNHAGGHAGGQGSDNTGNHAGSQALVVRANVADDADCRRLAAEVEARFGRIDVLVNNAGTTKFVAMKNLEGLSAEDFQAIYAVNVIGAYQLTRAFAPLLQAAPGGAIVNISSVASMMGRGSSLAYMASKGALNALTVGLARALGPTVRVNAIAPGFVETAWLMAGLGEARYAQQADLWRDTAALAATIEPDDVADAAWWLGAGAAKTTGEVLLVDAGFRLTKA